MNSAFWTGGGWLKPLWHFCFILFIYFLLWHESHGGCGNCSFAAPLAVSVPVHMCLCHSCEVVYMYVYIYIYIFAHSCAVCSTGLLRLKGQPCCGAIKMCRSVSAVVAASPAWHYKCAILRGKCPPSPRCDHTSLLGGLCWLTGVSAKYGTDMISWPWPPTPTLLHGLSMSVCLSSPSLISLT